MRMSTIALAVALAGASASCGSVERPAQAAGEGLRVVALDSIQLQDTDSIFLASPSFLLSGPAGTLYVSDGMNGHVLQFGAKGELIRRYGRPGKGPGELRSPMALALLGDSLLAITDWGASRTSLFDQRTGEFLRSVRQEGLPFWTQSVGDTVWMAALNHVRKTSVAVWPAADDTVRYLGPVPAEYDGSPLLMEAHPYATLARLEDNILVGFTGHHALFVTRPDGVVLDTVEIPAVRRRGVPRDLVQRFSQDHGPAEIASMGSALVALHQLSSGEIAAVYMDMTFKQNLVTADGFVSVLSRDFTKACVDAPLDFSHDGRPVVAFRGDTLVTLEQRVTPQGRADAVVKSYTLDTSACEWVAVQ